MNADPQRIIVTASCCEACSVDTVRVHHERFPELRVEGKTAEMAAGHLTNRLLAAQDSVSGPAHRDALRHAIDDTRAFLDFTSAARGADGISPARIPQERTVMAIPHAYPGIPVDLRPEDESFSAPRTTALVKNDRFEAIRLVLPRGHDVCHDHEVEGAITVQCVEGRVALTAHGRTHELPPGHWAYLPGHAPHTLRAVEDSVALLTVMFP